MKYSSLYENDDIIEIQTKIVQAISYNKGKSIT